MPADIVVFLGIRDDRLSVGTLEAVMAKTEELRIDVSVPCPERRVITCQIVFPT